MRTDSESLINPDHPSRRSLLAPIGKLCSRLLPATVALLLTANVRAEEGAPLRVQLRWLHQAQFAGYYVAEARSFHGHGPKQIELVEGGPGIDPLDRLVNGKADVAIGWLAQALEARAKGADIVNVAQIFRRPGMALVLNKGAGVFSATDLAGRSVGVWNVGDEISVRLWLQRAGVPESSVQFVPQTACANDFISGKVPCATVMLYTEYWNVLDAGSKPEDLHLVRFGDEALAMLEDGLYVRRERLDDCAFRRRLADFLKATARGWREARDHPNEAVSLTMAKSPGLDVTHQHRMLESIL